MFKANPVSDMSGFKKQSLSLDKKAEIIKAVDNAPLSKKKKTAADFGIPANTLSTILKMVTASSATRNKSWILKESDFKQ